LPNLIIIESLFTVIKLCQHYDFHINGRPSSWICYYVIILHPISVYHGPNVVLNFQVDWFGSLTYARLATDRQTDGQIAGHHHCLKPPPSTWGRSKLIK